MPGHRLRIETVMTETTTRVIGGKIGAEYQTLPEYALGNILPSQTVMRPILSRLTTIHTGVPLGRTMIRNQSLMNLPISFWRLTSRHPRRSATGYQLRIRIGLCNFTSMFIGTWPASKTFRNLLTTILGTLLPPVTFSQATKMNLILFTMKEVRSPAHGANRTTSKDAVPRDEGMPF